jgi:hypothetical protein
LGGGWRGGGRWGLILKRMKKTKVLENCMEIGTIKKKGIQAIFQIFFFKGFELFNITGAQVFKVTKTILTRKKI